MKVPFFSYHLMIGLGTLFIALTLLASLLRWRGRLWESRWLLWVFVFAVVGPIVANEVGWIAAEVGRQPWIVHPPVEWTATGDLVTGPEGTVVYDEALGLRTTDAVSPSRAREPGARLAGRLRPDLRGADRGVAVRARPQDQARARARG